MDESVKLWRTKKATCMHMQIYVDYFLIYLFLIRCRIYANLILAELVVSGRYINEEMFK